MEKLVFKNDQFMVTEVDHGKYVVSTLFEGEIESESLLLEKEDLNYHLLINNLQTLDEDDFIKKPQCELIGQDGNIYNLMGIVSRTLKKDNQHENSKYMIEAVISSHSYNEALQILMHYVDIC